MDVNKIRENIQAATMLSTFSSIVVAAVLIIIYHKDLEKEFKKSCQKFNYKKIARNPDDYIGQNFKVTVQIYSISEGGLFTQAYMKAYTDDGSGTYFDNMIYIFDDQDKNSDSYVHVLEDDVITVYGTFEGMEDSTNFLNGDKSKDIALHMKYVKLIME